MTQLETPITEISKRRLRRALGRGRSFWKRDSDGWLRRGLRRGDPTSASFNNSIHAFIEGGTLYCRTLRQAAQLDCGVVP